MARRIALAGNPNVGKSLLFTQLTGRYAEVSNFPGTTVEILSAPFGQDRLIDTPGVYGLSRQTEEERVALTAILDADLVVNVVDGTRLTRDLFLTLQLLDMKKPLIVVVTMADELSRMGARIDIDALSQRLGVPVLSVSGLTGQGLEAVRSAISQTPPTATLGEAVFTVPSEWGLSPAETLLWHEEDPEVMRRVGQRPEPGTREALYVRRRRRADAISEAVFQSGSRHSRWLGEVLLTPVGGAVALVVLLAAVYYLVGIVVANVVVGRLEELLQGAVTPALANLVALALPVGSWPYRLLVGEYGVVTAGLTYVAGLLLPLIIAFYLVLAILEDSGYLPRLATWLDAGFVRLGLNGRAVIPLVLGFGCVTMATLTTRMLSTERERRMATILLAWTIPCSAQMGVILGLLSGLGWRYPLIYAGIVLGLFITVGTVLDRTLPGQASPLLLDLPPMRWPNGLNILEKTRFKAVGFLREAGPLFLLGTGAIELAHMTGVMGGIDRVVGPFFSFWLGLPGQAASSFLLGFIRRDFGAVGLYAAGLSPRQILTGAVTLTLFVPCIASTLVIFKERGIRSGAVIWLGSILLALTAGGVVARLGRL